MAERIHRILTLMGCCETRGSTVQALTLIRGLQTRGYEIRVVCSNANLIGGDLRREIRFVERPALEWSLVRPLVQRCLARDLESEIPDLIHVQHRRMLPFGRWLAARWERPIVLSVHDYLAPGETLGGQAGSVQAVVSVSESVRDELLSRTGWPADSVKVIQGGVLAPDADSLHPILDPSRAPVIGTAGPLEAAKGIKYFLSAARLVLDEHPQVQFLIAGAGPEERALRKHARELEVMGHVTFVPNLTDFDASLSAMDVYVLPSLKQGLGTIMLEAMARSLPVIATSSGGVCKVVADGQTGVLVPPSDSVSLAHRMLDLLRDPLRARAIGERAREMVLRDFPMNRMIEQTVEVYEQVLTRKAA